MDIPQPVQRNSGITRISYAQNMEDILLDRLFRGGQGTFMDIGANHPYIHNNTYFFYLRGWRGVNIEPTPRGHALFLEHRPEDHNLRLAISAQEGSLPFYEVWKEDELTGLSTLSAEAAEKCRAEGYKVVETQVTTRTVASLIEEFNIEPPDLLSLDVESHESNVIRGIPLASWRPGVLVVESTLPFSPISNSEEWEPLLLEHGYELAAFNGINRFYLREDLLSKRHLLETPVNALDHYLPQDIVSFSVRLDDYRHRYEQEKAAREFDRAQFEEIRKGWEWGLNQALLAQTAWNEDHERFAHERNLWNEAREFFEHREADLLFQLRTETAHLNAVTQQRDDLTTKLWETRQERQSLEEQLRISKTERAERERQHEQERSLWQRECEDRDCRIDQAQALLRPYRLVDRLGLVTAGYRWARNWKRKTHFPKCERGLDRLLSVRIMSNYRT